MLGPDESCWAGVLVTVGDGIAIGSVACAITGLASVWIVVTNWCKVEQAKLADRRKR